jgi:hypothetical protein
LLVIIVVVVAVALASHKVRLAMVVRHVVFGGAVDRAYCKVGD